jgi:salicylate hydroxylase
MSPAGRTVYIAGAGIAGLTLALALAKFGATVIVLERNAKIQEFGAGVQISPNARRVLNQLGLDKAITNKSFEPLGLDVCPFGAKSPLVTLSLGLAARKRFGAPYAVIHRADLVEALFRACKRFANIDIEFNVRTFDVVSHARGISVTADMEGGQSRTARAFAFAGADGVNSLTRTAVLGGPKAAYSGYVAWRTTLPLAALHDVVASDRVSLLMGPGYHAVTYPLPQRELINVALFARESEAVALGDKSPAGPTLQRRPATGSRWDGLLKVAMGSWSFWPASTVEAASWHDGGIGLIGDAAHAMLPFQAQGAAMAMEDAAILAPLLMTEPTAESAFARFEGLRRRRVERVARLSRGNGFAFHLDWPLSLARDAAIAAMGRNGQLRRLRWVYGYDAAPEVETGAPPRP